MWLTRKFQIDRTIRTVFARLGDTHCPHCFLDAVLRDLPEGEPVSTRQIARRVPTALQLDRQARHLWRELDTIRSHVH